ncbi:aldehyde dehydrogenase family protein [candidate division LCP-89 bacterium B3_LCP]|uniref:aldehyde dehydrogenase (NAD(+)) n=1 Tax=candidate division LCP-89 bacterium B3_LCP TaxID=2012998 RepID=A0A532V227_UNCL8|nr:MAG: aldehyde dehydrogenase family protein [candidate division LCP-89 bacterium B3_LCP]
MDFLRELGIEKINPGACSGPGAWTSTEGRDFITSINPATGEEIASVAQASIEDYDKVMSAATEAFQEWRMMPAPQRGLIVRDLGEALRAKKDPLGKLVTLEMGKIVHEGWGEVQEMIDICDFALGLSRQLYGLTMHSERPRHRMYEQWHPLGVVGIISAFNFPVAVWAWNSAIAAVCGDVTLWKPSSETPLTGVAVQNICNDVMKAHNLTGIFNLVIGRGSVIGEKLINDRRIPLVSATGSCEMGYRIGKVVGERLGGTILELGGNNAIIVDETADMEMAVRAVLFGAVGTAGQRCTSTRRVFLHKSIAEDFTDRLIKAYKQVRIGDPLDENTLMGPLINQSAIDIMMSALETINDAGGELLYGGNKTGQSGFYVEPAIIKAEHGWPIVHEETFAPILYLIEYESLEDAIAWHNEVPQGLSSAIFTKNLLAAETFLSHEGSDCGIANVNIGTSGAEIGGAFGGEKETGGGRESGSDSWKAYMRRQTNTINWSKDLPLAQGITFE